MIQPSKLIQLPPGSYAALFLAVIFFLFSLGRVVDAECEVCTGNPQQSNNCPPSRIGDCLILRCNIETGRWYLSSPANNVTIGTSDADNRLTNYRIFGEVGTNGLKLFSLNITKNTNQNYGPNRIFHQESPAFGINWCYFSIFVFGNTFLLLFITLSGKNNV